MCVLVQAEMAKYEEEMKAAGRSIHPQVSYDGYYEGSQYDNAPYDPALGQHHDYGGSVPGAGLPGLQDGGHTNAGAMPFEIPLPNPPHQHREHDRSGPNEPISLPTPNPPAPRLDLPQSNGKPGSPTKKKEDKKASKAKAEPAASEPAAAAGAWGTAAKKGGDDSSSGSAGGFVLPSPLPASPTREAGSTQKNPQQPAAASAQQQQQQAPPPDVPRIGAKKKQAQTSTERAKAPVAAPTVPLRSVRKQVSPPKKPTVNEWLTVKKGDIEKETIELPEGSTPQAGGTSPLLESKSGFEALESQKRESLDEERPLDVGVTIIDRASVKEARKRSQKESAKEAKKAERKTTTSKSKKGDGAKGQVDAWYAHVTRSIFGRDMGLLDVPIKVLYGLAAVVMLVVLYFVIFIL